MEYIAVMDLGTSKMLALAASKAGRHKMIASAKIESGDTILRGLIYKTEEAASKIVDLVKNLDQQLKPGLKKIYVGIGGQALHSQLHTIQKTIEEGEVNIELLEALENECMSVEDESYDLIDVVSREYSVDGHSESQPEGVQGETLEAKYQLIRGYSSAFKQKVEQALQKAGFETAGYFVSPLATAEAALTAQEKQAGCALVEIGAGLTYLSIYTDGLLRYLVTIPMAGNAVTQDIYTLKKITEAEAEILKQTTGNAISDEDNRDVNQWIEARVVEIATNVKEQILRSGYADVLTEGIILTGGSANLKNIDGLFAQLTNRKVRLANVDSSQACALGMLQLGKENCSLPEEIKAKEPPTDIFGNPETPDKSKKKKKNLGDMFFSGSEKSKKEKPEKIEQKQEKPINTNKPEEENKQSTLSKWAGIFFSDQQ